MLLVFSLDKLWKTFAILGPILCLLGGVWLNWGFEIIAAIVGLFL